MIDIKELRAGCHLLLSNRRVKVANIDSLNNLIGVEDYYYVADDGTKYCIGNEPKNLEPIPITEELLKELGFEEDGMDFYKHLDDNLCISFNSDNAVIIWHVEDGMFTLDLASMDNCQYLHELETFVYLTTKQELI